MFCAFGDAANFRNVEAPRNFENLMTYQQKAMDE